MMFMKLRGLIIFATAFTNRKIEIKQANNTYTVRRFQGLIPSASISFESKIELIIDGVVPLRFIASLGAVNPCYLSHNFLFYSLDNLKNSIFSFQDFNNVILRFKKVVQ